MKLRLAVLLSGSGTTLQNIIDLCEAETLDATVSCVIASRSSWTLAQYGSDRLDGISSTA